eukprot:PhM_4_TR2140/c1_g1_i1/m.13601
MDYRSITAHQIAGAVGLMLASVWHLWSTPFVSVFHILCCVIIMHVEGIVDLAQHGGLVGLAYQLDVTFDKLTHRGVFAVLVGTSTWLAPMWADVVFGLLLVTSGARYIMQAAVFGEEFDYNTTAPWMDSHIV